MIYTTKARALRNWGVSPDESLEALKKVLDTSDNLLVLSVRRELVWLEWCYTNGHSDSILEQLETEQFLSMGKEIRAALEKEFYEKEKPTAKEIQKAVSHLSNLGKNDDAKQNNIPGDVPQNQISENPNAINGGDKQAPQGSNSDPGEAPQSATNQPRNGEETNGRTESV
ncbi:hypothetical protein [Leptospira ilyithenensis]|uniref:Uncharacterized protein n=1 Tax=Leptospira ilyithenensis TaxID=2484901 RepID=A0A4V3JWY9_9LEPT|nr:hypothetical protein [Leptospira ilyithenensis]TGN09774.1 hypothetical protein EHS11_11875 [Leptospira ilyithenensis]